MESSSLEKLGAQVVWQQLHCLGGNQKFIQIEKY